MSTKSVSKAALNSIDAGSICGRVLAHIRNAPSTCDEIEVALDLRHQTASARVNELRDAGRIREDGTRKTRSGRQATVWRVVQNPEQLHLGGIR